MQVTERLIDEQRIIEKRLSSAERSSDEAIRRLRAETRLLGALRGGPTPRLLMAGEDEEGPFFRMELVPLPTLASRIEGARALEPAWIERAAVASFGTLATLHEAADDAGPLGIVHGDLSPSNIAFDDAGRRAVLFDLELALFRDHRTRNGAFCGTIAYAAPEVARGEIPTVRSDLFGLAATLLAAILGTAPREAGTLAASIALAAERPVLEPRHAALAARGPGHAALLACLAHDPDERPGSAREVLALVSSA
jgi:eukaryotic-like serine/threonine-protein kinase